MNATSSRSHTLFKMVIEMRDMEASITGGEILQKEWKDKKTVNWSSLFLVDLAGSERIKKVNGI